jgi:DNA polymerase-3 subunit delta
MARKPATATKEGQLFAVVGSDESEVKRVARELAMKLAPPAGGDFGTEIIDGAVETVDLAASRIYATIDALQTLPFFGGEKLVWLKSCAFLGDSVSEVQRGCARPVRAPDRGRHRPDPK